MTDIDRCACEETFRRLDDYLDRELTAEELRAVKRHLDTCGACAEAYAFEDAILEEIRKKINLVAVPEDLRRRILARLDQSSAGQDPA